MGHDNTQNETLNESVNDHLDTDLVDKNVLNAMVLDNITQNYPGIKQFFATIKLIEVNRHLKEFGNRFYVIQTKIKNFRRCSPL